MEIVSKLKKTFEEVFQEKSDNIRVFFSPGRVNLIGEHIDYNGGYVFPCALTLGTYAVVKKRDDKKFRAYSCNFPHLGVIEFNLDNLDYDQNHMWANYLKGVIFGFKREGLEVNTGMDVAIKGNIPNSSGLSSSASVELLMSIILKELFKLKISTIHMIKISQKSENDFMGVNCGIMDQFAIGMGKRGKAMLLQCDTLDFSYVDFNLDDKVILISNTNKRRELTDSKYNERREECERALNELKKEVEVNSLCAMTIEEFEASKHLIKNANSLKRARHAVYENVRTVTAAKALNDGNIELFGKLMNESHESLKNDYEVTGIELDTLVELAREQRGVLGSRMTGAGFGGCTVSIVEKSSVEDIILKVGSEYEKRIGWKASFYVASIGDGAGEIK